METDNVDQTWPVGAGWSALTTLVAMLCDLEIDDTDLNLTDDDLEMDEQYYEFYAVIAYANGTPDLPSADRARRQQFWNWWLTEERQKDGFGDVHVREQHQRFHDEWLRCASIIKPEGKLVVLPTY